MNLGENIYRFRTRQNMSQGDLADALDVSRQSVSKWENNNAVPELDKLVRMSKLFNITLDELIQGSEAPVPDASPVHPVPSQSSFPVRKLTGILLLVCGILGFLILTLLGGLLFGYLFGVPLAVIGAVLAFSEHDWLFRICWLMFACFCPVLSIFGYNFIRFDIHNVFSVTFLVLFSGLILWSVLGFRKKRLAPNSKKIALFSVCLLILVALFFSALLIPQSSPNELLTDEAEISVIAE